MNKTIVIPCFNEKKTIIEILDKVKNNLEKEDEIIIVDDFSSDGTREILKNLEDKSIKVLYHDKNYGKGKALSTAFKEKLNEIVIIQDADLEYDPNDYSQLLEPFIKTNAEVVYGSRFLGSNKYTRLHFFWHSVANKILTLFCNLITNLNMTDMETGYKAFKKDVIKSINIEETSFGVEPEITIKLAKKKYIFYEVPISYAGRSYSEGKKIRIKDAFRAIYCIFLYGLKR
tara:strand:+ start:477 stop:1166 length:690 start_codon:yes stop_codon:yes gene_type:complete